MKGLVWFGLLMISLSGFAQVITFPYEENFAWQVKQIDEFIDRFNNADYTPLRRYLKEQYQMEEVERVALLQSLFNFESQAWNKREVMRFLEDVTQSSDPPYLDFYDKDWYAVLDCVGDFQKEKKKFTLVLSIKLNERTGAAKWIINGVQADFLPAVDSTLLVSSLNNPSKSAQSINPASFGTDFMALVDALADTASFGNYLNRKEISPPLLAFFEQLYQRKLIFRQVSHITYHFLQVPGWIFQVEDYPRQTTNSGWLISKIIPATHQDKKDYRKATLHLHSSL